MPKKGKAKNHPSRSLRDVTLDVFANKSFIKNSTKEKNKTEDKSVVLKKHITEPKIDHLKGFNYPFKIWFLISEHISPEDVGVFAAICKTSLAVVCSATFWFTLYKRYYKNVPNMPERLQPERMRRLYGLRTCVIRALHYSYNPYVTITKNVIPLQDHANNLVKRQCIQIWQRKLIDKWGYFFKFKRIQENSNVLLNHQNKPSHQPKLSQMLQDVSANNEKHCRILYMTCPDFIPMPPVIGFRLSTIKLTSSAYVTEFNDNSLQMRFEPVVSYHQQPLDGDGFINIVLDPVINMSILDWWHPLYPHSETTSFAVLNEED